MAKKDYDKIHRANIDVYAQKIQTIYDSAVKEASSIGATIPNFNPDKMFSFSDYPITATRVEALVKSLQSNLDTAILNGIKHEWTLSNNKNNELSQRVFGDKIGKISKKQEQRYFNNNLNARDAFIQRKTAGLSLSDRVWKYTDQFKEEIELGLDLGLRDRLSAPEMARDLKSYLQNPDKLFRRVRDEHGILQLSKSAKAFNPGQGVYRSSVKNAQRLARTETNIAYRTADHERWQQFDFVVGIEVRRSNNLSCHCPLCDSLAGQYPKGFKFTGWHPQCRCHAVPILKTIDELQQETEQIIQGVPTSSQSVNSVDALPDGYNEWIEQNKGRFGADNTPYFIRDNFKDGKIAEGLKVATGINKQVISNIIVPKPLSIQERANIRHGNRTEEQINDIQGRWDERKANLTVNNKVTDELYAKITTIEDEIRMNAKYETAVLYDKKGNVQIDKRGKATSVSFTNDEFIKMKDGILTHNHPRGWAQPENTLGRIGNSFSPADIRTAVSADLSEIRAVTPTYTFTMKRPIQGWGVSPNVLKNEIKKMENEVIDELKKYVVQHRGKESLDRAYAITYHRLSKKIASKYGWEYSKAKTR